MFIIGVVKVADCKQNVNRHLNSAQQWLTEAEQAFDKDKDIRGELTLFLAQAELTHAREANRAHRWRYRYPVLRHGLALGLAAVVAIGGVGASYWWGVSRHQAQPVSVIHQSVPAAQPNVLQVTPAANPVTPAAPSSAAVPAETPAEAKAQPAVDQESPRSYRSTEPSEPTKAVSDAGQSKEVPLTAEEINKLVRSAGKSLRGQ